MYRPRLRRLGVAALVLATSIASLSVHAADAAPAPTGLAANTRACGGTGGAQVRNATAIPLTSCAITVDAPGRIFITASASVSYQVVGASPPPSLLAQFNLTVDGTAAAQSAREINLVPGSSRSLHTQTAVSVTAGAHAVTLQGLVGQVSPTPSAVALAAPASISVYFVPSVSSEIGCVSPTVAAVPVPRTPVDANTPPLAECSINIVQPMVAEFSASTGVMLDTFGIAGVTTKVVVDGVDVPNFAIESTNSNEQGPYSLGAHGGTVALTAGVHVFRYAASAFNGNNTATQPSIMVTAAPTGSEDVKRCQGAVAPRFRQTSASFVQVADGCSISSSRAQLVQITGFAQLIGTVSGEYSQQFQLMIDGVLQTDTDRTVSLRDSSSHQHTMVTQTTRALAPGPHTVSLHTRRASGAGTTDIAVASLSIRIVTDIPPGAGGGGGGATPDYVSVVPDRVLDTRPGVQVGYTGAKPATGATVQLDVTGVGTSKVPDNAVAVVLNVTGSEAEAGGFVTVWPCGSPQPNASNLNLRAGVTSPNLVVAKIGPGGLVCLFTQSSAHLIADVNGFMPSTSRYTSVVPERLLDTRTGSKPTPGATTEVQITGAGVTKVPATAKSVVLNVTATEADVGGFVTVWPCGSPRPTASNLNIPAGGTAPNLVVSKLGTDGKVCIFVQSAMHLIADVNGFMPADSTFVSVVPERLLDTRTDGQVGFTGAKPAPGATIELTVTGAGVTKVPAGTNAVVLNVTGVEPDADGFVTVWPCGSPRPTASNLNLSSGGVSPNLVMSKIGDGGKVCIFTQPSTHLIADVSGFWP